MEKDQIHLDDFYRIFIGQVPPEFYIELIIRTICVYAIIMFGMKYMGKRIAGELSRSELAALSTLAAATGLVLLSPERGLISPLIVLGVIYVIRLLVIKKNYSSKRFEEATEGKRSTLIMDGEMQWQEMKKARISKEQLMAQLRALGVVHLGTVKRFCMEANGGFTLTKEPNPRPGLAAIPDWDIDFLNELTYAKDAKVCTGCGHRQRQEEAYCPVCKSVLWTCPVTDNNNE
ncbi:DUF421 domain-containing protein [Longitalea luteola]|uniref:DUF421 domain-containing protein n=1 Tax=Longitalea luteola TaxID=2812563 RepID=UPI001A972700|nr:YetF domain-containing protein [Longitalea luteola]